MRLLVPVHQFPTLAFFLLQIALRVVAAEKLETFSVRGEKYVSLTQWAEARNFSYSWDKANRLVKVSSRWSKFVYNINSKKASLNDVTFWLSFPVLPKGDSVFISDRDLDKMIHPLLYPAKVSKGRSVRTILVAAGHGGKDPGYQINRDQEKKYTLLMAKALKEALVRSGFRVILARDKDVFIDLGDQAAHANRVRADLFINLHYNAAIDVDASGVETYCLTPAGAISTNGGSPTPRSPGHRQDSFNPLLAYHIHKALTSKCAFEDRGIRRAAFQVLREITMPGVLIEGGFLSNRRDAQKIKNAAQRDRVARAIADGIVSYKRVVEGR